MAATLLAIRRATAFEHLPGFGRLRGFVIAIIAAFLLAWGMMRTGIRLFFFSSIWMFFLLVAILYALLRWGLRELSRPRRSPPGRD
jgi:high-affinity Fe2+/Pb2+ permease